MLLDRFNRRIDYLRISVTDRCNRCCVYCVPEAAAALKSRSEILSYEQIESLVKVAAIDGIDEVCMTTNGSLLADMATKLKRKGTNN